MNGQASEVRPAGPKPNGGVSLQSVHAAPSGVLQAGRDSEGRHSHRDTVSLQTRAQKKCPLQPCVDSSPSLLKRWYNVYHKMVFYILFLVSSGVQM